MVNQQKGVQQDTAYIAVVVNVSSFLPISCFYDPIWVKNGTGIQRLPGGCGYARLMVGLDAE